MHKVGAVIRREFIERVRSKWFWISAILLPVLFAAIFLVPTMLAGSGSIKRIAVLDATTPPLGARVTAALSASGAFEATRVPGPEPRVIDSLVAEIGARRLEGVLVLGDDVVTSGSAEYRGSNVSSIRDIEEIERVLDAFVTAARLERAGIDPAVMARATLPIRLTTKKISGSRTTGESSAQSFSLAYFMGILLYTSILMYGVNVKSSVLEEKTTRIVEVLVSSVRPFSLLLGKILGVGAVSLFQLVIWGVAGRLLFSERAALARRLGGFEGAPPFLEIPHVSAATAVVFVAYFLGGFFIYSAMFAAAGAMSSSEQEAQQAQQPIVLVLLFSFLSLFALVADPSSTFAVALSLIPFTSPIAMPVRWAAGDLPPADLGVSLLLLVLGIIGVTWIAARIYRVGILMTGKRPGVKELVRWIRAA
jgi:ABC-2 type transport system permease protein